MKKHQYWGVFLFMYTSKDKINNKAHWLNALIHPYIGLERVEAAQVVVAVAAALSLPKKKWFRTYHFFIFYHSFIFSCLLFLLMRTGGVTKIILCVDHFYNKIITCIYAILRIYAPSLEGSRDAFRHGKTRKKN